VIKKKYDPPAHIKIRKGDTVKVLTGRDRGKTGRVIEVNRARGRVVVEGVMLVKRHTRPNPQRQIKGGIAEREASIHVSNVAIVASDGKPSRIGYRVETTSSGVVRRTRVARKTGEPVDRK
jgi:large subunit ribosomal protein L24